MTLARRLTGVSCPRHGNDEPLAEWVGRTAGAVWRLSPVRSQGDHGDIRLPARGLHAEESGEPTLHLPHHGDGLGLAAKNVLHRLARLCGGGPWRGNGRRRSGRPAKPGRHRFGSAATSFWAMRGSACPRVSVKLLTRRTQGGPRRRDSKALRARCDFSFAPWTSVALRTSSVLESLRTCSFDGRRGASHGVRPCLAAQASAVQAMALCAARHLRC
jgi:hypothetical protein